MEKRIYEYILEYIYLYGYTVFWYLEFCYCMTMPDPIMPFSSVSSLWTQCALSFRNRRFSETILYKVFPPTFENVEIVQCQSTRRFSSTAVTKSCVVTDGRPDRGSSGTLIFSAMLESYYSFIYALCCPSRHWGRPYTSLTCGWIAAAETFLGVKNKSRNVFQ